MKLLCIDIGSGTQDILFLDSRKEMENAIQLVLPAPTVIVAGKIQGATSRGDAIFLTGETMGGGACTAAIREHLAKGLPVYATQEAARSLSDDLARVTSWGIKLISADEVSAKPGRTVIEMKDVWLETLEQALSGYNVSLTPEVIGVAVLDHGAAPPGESERLFRFKFLEKTLKTKSSLEALIYRENEVPAHFTRMQGVIRSLGGKTPLLLMDTGAAAVLGSSLDPVVSAQESHIGVNVGNSHTVAFSLSARKIHSMFEHHTSLLSLARLETLIEKLRSGTIQPGEVWSEGGHGSLIIEKKRNHLIAVTGPRRSLLQPSSLKPYFSAPFGSMMLAGCFGLVTAVAIKFPEWQDAIEKLLGSSK